MIFSLPQPYVDHLVAPRGRRDLEAAEAAGQWGSMIGGMGVRVTLTWREGPNGEPRIGDLGVRVFGSAAPIAPASWLASWAPGRSDEEAQELRASQIMDDLLGGDPDAVPLVVHRAAGFAVNALRCALGLPLCRPADPRGRGILVCRCLDVGDRQIRKEIAEGARTPEEIGDGCGASTGCRTCREDLLVLLQEELEPDPVEPPADRHAIARIALACVGPVLASRGLPLRDAEVTNTGVLLHLGDPLPECVLPPRGAAAIARHVLKDVVRGDLEVRIAE